MNDSSFVKACTKGRVHIEDVAAQIVASNSSLGDGRLTGTMFLQKIVYYCQAWWVAKHGVDSPLFSSEFEAWTYGPVSSELYQYHKGKVSVDIDSWKWGNRDNLTKEKNNFVDYVFNYYGSYSGFQLSARTHKESPWLDAWAKGPSTVITLQAMYDCYSKRTKEFFFEYRALD